MPSKLSLAEASDIIEILQKIVSEAQKKDLTIDLTHTENKLSEIYDLISEKIDREDAREANHQKALTGKLDELKDRVNQPTIIHEVDNTLTSRDKNLDL